MSIGCTKPGPLLCEGSVDELLVELKLLFKDDKLTLLPVLAPLLLFCDDNELDASTFGAEVFKFGIAGLMKRSLRRP